MTANLSEIPGAFHLPRPNWDVLRTWVKGHTSEADRPQAWAEIAAQWLGVLNEALDGAYRTQQSGHLLLFAPSDYAHAEFLLHFAESALATIVDALGNVAGESWLGPLAVLLFADAKTYHLYTSPFHPEGEYGRSAGMCLREGYVHIALQPGPLDMLQRNMLHEITHACLGHLSLPLWLEEGVAQLAEEEVLPSWRRFTLDGTGAEEIRQYWREHGLQNFWWGKGFYLHDAGQGYSYALAQILFRLIVADNRRRVPDFVRHAHAGDAGDSAAREFLRKSLVELAAQFLGDGAWEPVPPDGPSYCRRGSWHLSRREYDRAIADFNAAIQLDPRFAEAYSNRGLARFQLKHYAEAIGDYERAIQLNPKDLYAHNNLAWVLATCPDEHRRDGERALDHARKAWDLAGFPPWFCLGTLAAACAEVGDFDEARTSAKEAMRLTPEEERAGCKERLRLYKEGKPYRSPPGNPAGGTPSMTSAEC
jgi:tetratricopeptide (TPR) repeat protein